MNTSNLKFYITSLIIVAAGLYTTLTTSIYNFAPTDFGLVNRLPIIYWAGLVAIGILFYISRDSIYKSAAAFIFLIIFLFVIPTVVREPVWLSNSFYPYANSLKANDIRSSINLNQETDISTSYYYWPLFLFLASIINITTYSDVDFILKFFPILTMVIVGVMSYLIFNMKFKETSSIVGASLVIGSFWLRQQYFGPPAISYIFFFFVLYIFAYLIFRSSNFRNEIYIIFMLFFVSILFTHLLTFAIVVFMLGSIFILDRIKHLDNYKPLFYLTILSGVAGAAYYLRGYLIPSSGGISKNYISWIITTLKNSITKISELALYKETSRIQATLPQRLNYYSSWAIVGLTAICIIYLMVTFVLKRFDLKNILWEKFSLFLVLFLACLGFMAVALAYGAEESYQRAFMFGILPFIYFSLTVLDKHKNIVYLGLFAIILLNIPAQYGADNFRVATSTQLSGSKFFSDFAVNSIETTCVNAQSLYVRYFNPNKHFIFKDIGTLPFTSIVSITNDLKTKLNTTKFLMLSNEEYNFFKFYINQDPVSDFNYNEYQITKYPVNSKNLGEYIKTNYAQNNVTEFYTSKIYDNSRLQIKRLLKTYTVTSLMETKDGITLLFSEQVLSGTHLSFNIPTLTSTQFDHWEVNGENWGDERILNITVSGSRFVNAVFYPGLKVEISGPGNVTYLVNQTYIPNTKVELNAQPNIGFRFDKWSGDSNSSIQEITITMDRNKYLEANFIPASFNYTDTIDSFTINRSYINDTARSFPLKTQDIFFSKNDSLKFQTYSDSPSSYNSFTYYNLTSSETGDEVYARGYFNLGEFLQSSTLGNDQSRFSLLRFRTENLKYSNTTGWLAWAGITHVMVNNSIVNNWTLFANDGNTFLRATNSSAINPKAWYCIELHWKQSDTRGFAEMFVDGNLVSNLNYVKKNGLANVKYIDVGVISVTHPNTDITVCADNILISNGYIGK